MYLETSTPYTSAELGIEYPIIDTTEHPAPQEPTGLDITRFAHQMITNAIIESGKQVLYTRDLDEYMKIQKDLNASLFAAQDAIWNISRKCYEAGFSAGLQAAQNGLIF